MAFKGWIQQSTATTEELGPCIQTDGDSEYTTAIAAANITLTKDGGAAAAKNDATATAHKDSGVHSIVFNATDTNTLGPLHASAHEAGMLVVDDWWQVTATGYPEVNAVEVSGAAPETAADTADAVHDEAKSGHTTTGTFGGEGYWSKLDLRRDPSADEYTVTWFFRDGYLASGCSSPKIYVYKRSDFSALIADDTAMTLNSDVGDAKYDESVNTMSAQEAYFVVTKITHNGAERTWKHLVGKEQ